MNFWKQKIMAKKEEGAALVIAIIILSAVEVLGFALITMSQIDYSVATNIARSEEALYSAEQGVMMGIDKVVNDENPPVAPIGGTVYTLYSADYRGKGNYSTGSDPYPRWEAVIKFLGLVPPRPGEPSSFKTYRYLIECTGTGIRGVTRRIKAVIAAFKPIKGGLQAEEEGWRQVERKLAATTRPQ